MRELRPSGSVGDASSNRCVYPELLDKGTIIYIHFKDHMYQRVISGLKSTVAVCNIGTPSLLYQKNY